MQRIGSPQPGAVGRAQVDVVIGAVGQQRAGSVERGCSRGRRGHGQRRVVPEKRVAIYAASNVVPRVPVQVHSGIVGPDADRVAGASKGSRIVRRSGVHSQRVGRAGGGDAVSVPDAENDLVVGPVGQHQIGHGDALRGAHRPPNTETLRAPIAPARATVGRGPVLGRGWVQPCRIADSD